MQPRSCSHCQQPCDLVDAGDGAAGELGKLGVDLRRRRLRNLTGGLGKCTVNVEATLVDLAAERPQIACSAGGSGGSRSIKLALDFDVLLAVVVKTLSRS